MPQMSRTPVDCYSLAVTVMTLTRKDNRGRTRFIWFRLGEPIRMFVFDVRSGLLQSPRFLI